MTDKIDPKASTEALKTYLAEEIKTHNIIALWIDKNIYLVGLIRLIQEVTKGLTPLCIARTAAEFAKIKMLLDTNPDIKPLLIYDIKYNLFDDEPRGEQLAFNWKIGDGDIINVESSYSLVGKIRHRGFQS